MRHIEMVGARLYKTTGSTRSPGVSAGRAAADPPFTALVLAGSRGAGDPVARAAGVAHKCLVPVAGVPMAVRVVETLAACPSVGRIALALEDPALLDDLPGCGR